MRSCAVDYLIILLISLYLIIALTLPFRQRNLGEEILQTLEYNCAKFLNRICRVVRCITQNFLFLFFSLMFLLKRW
jgi:hypothetical protein